MTVKNKMRDNCKAQNQPTEEPTQLFYILRHNVIHDMNDYEIYQIKRKVYERFPELDLIEQMTDTNPKSRIPIENAIEKWKDLGNLRNVRPILTKNKN